MPLTPQQDEGSEPAKRPDAQADLAETKISEYNTLRIWPAICLSAMMILGRLSAGILDYGPPIMWAIPAFAPALMGLGILLWWGTFSRARWTERLIGLFGVLAGFVVASFLSHPSLHGPPIVMIVLPLGILLFAATLICTAKIQSAGRTWLALTMALVGFGITDFIRTDGVSGVSYQYSFSPRWQASEEELYLASLKNDESAPAKVAQDIVSASEVFANPVWPRFRGKLQNSRVESITIDPNWGTNPPKVIWRRPVGPSWSSFVAAGDFLFTQEQRGELETVVCLQADTGDVIWTQETKTRFDESMAGPGPRATPTIADGSLFTLGANGLLQALDLATGEVVWRHELMPKYNLKLPMWGFSSSPLVVDGKVIVTAVEVADHGIMAYDAKDGTPSWSTKTRGMSYSSPQLVEVGGRRTIALLSGTGLTLYSISDGSVQLDYNWECMGYRTVQPLMVGDEMVIGSNRGTGSRRISLSSDGATIVATEGWTSLDMKPDFNDFVAHKGAIYGFDQSLFACIDFETGQRNWKRGRYGKGQVLLLPQSDQLLVLSEEGELVLLSANPEKHDELARFPVISGKTWNHPIMVGNRVYVRNGQEAACVELPSISSVDNQASGK